MVAKAQAFTTASCKQHEVVSTFNTNSCSDKGQCDRGLARTKGTLSSKAH